MELGTSETDNYDVWRNCPVVVSHLCFTAINAIVNVPTINAIVNARH